MSMVLNFGVGASEKDEIYDCDKAKVPFFTLVYIKIIK